MEHRFNALRRRFRTLGIAGYIVSRPSNIRWLCGFTGSNGLLLVTGKSAHFITDGRRFLTTTPYLYDLIFGDVYFSFSSIPPHFFTK